MSLTLKDIIEKAQELLPIVTAVVPIVVPGSGAAIKVAEAVETVSSLLRFGDKVLKETLPELASQLDAIKSEMEAVAASGEDGVPIAHFAEIENDILTASQRIKTALQAGGTGAAIGGAIES